MKRKRYSEEKIISILKEHEAGVAVPDLSRRYEIAENTIYRWKSVSAKVPAPLPPFLDYVYFIFQGSKASTSSTVLADAICCST